MARRYDNACRAVSRRIPTRRNHAVSRSARHGSANLRDHWCSIGQCVGSRADGDAPLRMANAVAALAAPENDPLVATSALLRVS